METGKYLIIKKLTPGAFGVECLRQGCSDAGMRWNAVPANILEPERRSGKYRWPQVER